MSDEIIKSPRYDLMTDKDYEVYLNLLNTGYKVGGISKKHVPWLEEDQKRIDKWKEEATRQFHYHKYNNPQSASYYKKQLN